MRKIAIILVVLMAFILSYSLIVQGISFYVADQIVDLAQPMIIVNGTILIPISLFPQHLGADVQIDDDTIYLKFPTKNITMQVGEKNVQVDGENSILDVAPERSKGEVMVPLRFIADLLDLRLVFDTDAMALMLLVTEQLEQLLAVQLVRDPDLSGDDSITVPLVEPLSDPLLRDIVYLGGPRSRVFIDVQGHTGYESVLLTNPDRLVVDLLGITSEALPVQSIGDTIIQRIRSSQFNDRMMRIVFDLNQATGYEIHRWPDGGLEVELNYQISEVGFSRDEVAKIWFYATDQPPFEVDYIEDPDRLVMDFQNSTLLSGAMEFAVNDPRVRRVRVSQFMPSITRVVLELDEPMTPMTVTKTDGRYEVLLYEGTTQQYNAYLKESEKEVVSYPISDPVDDVTIGIDSLQKLRGRVIALDPGHGGSDPGAIGSRGTFEKDVVLAISLKLGKMLHEAGARVIFTRTDDRYISVFDRPRIAEVNKAEILISIHANSYIHQKVKGTETLYNPLHLENFRLAQSLQSELIAQLRLVDRGLRPRTDLAVLNGAKMPAALVEVAFLNYPEEEKLLRSSEFQYQAAQAMYDGIIRYFRQYR